MSTQREEGCILAGATGGAFVIRFEGRLTQKSMWNMDHAVERCQAAGWPRNVVVDVAHCAYMDSTMLGLLARLAISHRKLHSTRPFLLGLGGGELATIFKRMSLDQLFTGAGSSAEALCPPAFVCVESRQEADARERKNQLLLAHQTLAELSDENAKAFEDVIEMLTRETPV